MNYASFRPVAICLFLAVAGVASLSADVCTTAGSRCTDGIFFDSGSGSGGQNHTGVVTVVQRFTPASYPFVLTSACVGIGRLDQDPDLDYEVVLFDDDGTGGEPGTELGAVNASAVDVPFLGTTTFFTTSTVSAFPTITSGGFYLGIRWDTSSNPGFMVLNDPTVDGTVRYYSRDGGSWTSSMESGAFLVRAGTVPTYGKVVKPDDSRMQPNLRLWLRAEDLLDGLGHGDLVTLWSDVSGSGNDASPATAFADEPVLDVQGLATVKFPEYNLELLKAPGIFGGVPPTDLTMVALYKCPVSDSKLRPVGFGAHSDGSTADNFTLAADPSIRKDSGAITGYGMGHPSEFFLRAATMSSSNGLVADFFNGGPALLPVAEAFTVGTDDLYLGDLRDWNINAAVDIVEVAVYDRALSEDEIKGLSDYISAKYRSRCYFRFEEGTAASPVNDVVMDSTVNPNNANAVTGAASNPAWSDDVPLAEVPLTGSSNLLSLDLERDDQQYLEVEHDLSLGIETSMTIEAWVRLETLSDDSDGLSAEDRQYLVLKKTADGADEELNYAFLVQAGDLSVGADLGSGDHRNLALQLSDGFAPFTVISSMGLSDNQWHYVAVAFDCATGEATFVLDDAVEVLIGLSVTPVPNSSELYIGAHHTAGTVDSAFDGRIDELRITGGLLPFDQLLPVAPAIFLDSFESTDLSRWSTTVP